MLVLEIGLENDASEPIPASGVNGDDRQIRFSMTIVCKSAMSV